METDVIRTPLVEATIEVRFRGDARIEAWRGDFQASVRDRYPNMLVPNVTDGKAPALLPYVFENESRTAGVGLAVNSFFHRTKEYPGWRRFSENAIETWEMVNRAISPSRLTRIGIRYVNQFVDDMLKKVDSRFESSFLRPLIDEPRMHHSLTIQGSEDSGMTIRVEFDRDKHLLTVDSDVFEQDVEPDQIREKVESLHKIVEDHFFSVLVPEYVEQLKATARE